MGGYGSILEMAARGSGYDAQQQQIQRDLANSSIASTKAQIPLTEAQVPLAQQQAEEARQRARQLEIETQQRQISLADLKAETDALARVRSGQQDQPAPGQPEATPAQPTAATPPVQAPPETPAANPATLTPPAQASTQGGSLAALTAPQPRQQLPSPTPQAMPSVPAGPPTVAGVAGGKSASIAGIYSNPGSYAKFLNEANISPRGYFDRMKAYTDYQKELAGLTKSQLDNEKEKYQAVGELGANYLSNPSPEAWQAVLPQWHRLDPETATLAEHLAAGNPAPNEQQIGGALALTDAHGQMAKLAEAKATTEAKTAETNKTNFETEKNRFLFNYQKKALSGTDPIQAGSGALSQSPIFAGHPTELADAQDAWTKAYQAELAKDPTNAANAGNTAAQGIANRLREFSPAVVAGKAREAKETLKATAPIQESIQAASQARENAYKQGDEASGKYYESLTTAKKAEATAATIQSVVSLAKTGNNLSAEQLKSIIPEFTNAAQDIKRMGGPQAEAYATTFDRAIGELKSSGGFTPLTAKAIADIQPYVDTIANGAVHQHNANVDALSQAYPQKKFGHEPDPVQYLQNKQGHMIVSRDGGKTFVDAKTGEPVK